MKHTRTFKFFKEEYRAWQECADELTEGNITQLVRIAMHQYVAAWKERVRDKNESNGRGESSKGD